MRTWQSERSGYRITATTNPDKDRFRSGLVGKDLYFIFKSDRPGIGCIVSRSDIIEPYRIENGRLSLLPSTLELLKGGYSWTQYTSFEHEIELRKGAYYRELTQCQGDRPGEDVSGWVNFYMGILGTLQKSLETRPIDLGSVSKLSPR